MDLRELSSQVQEKCQNNKNCLSYQLSYQLSDSISEISEHDYTLLGDCYLYILEFEFCLFVSSMCANDADDKQLS